LNKQAPLSLEEVVISSPEVVAEFKEVVAVEAERITSSHTIKLMKFILNVEVEVPIILDPNVEADQFTVTSRLKPILLKNLMINHKMIS
jgi:hypothetical protein